MFGALGFFGSIEDERHKPDLFGAEGFFGAAGGAPAGTFRILAESGDIITAEGGTRINTEELP